MVDGPPASPEPARLGRYVLLDEIASGGMATVYLARLEGPEGFQRTVALKRPHPHLARNAGAMTMFLDEARMAARIRHVNVVPTLDVVDEGGQVALVMEYVEGEPLSGLMQLACDADLEVPLGVAARVACDMLEGLHAAHEVRGDDGAPLGLVHRDVSPHNVLVGVDGLARVVDFGIAKAEGRMFQTAESGVKGKLGYVAPEYLSKGELDRRSDLYATGVVLWEMIAGRRLFLGRSEHEVMTRVLTLVVPPLGALRLDTPAALAAAVERALSRDPDERFPDGQAMARALRAALPVAANDEVGAWVRSLAAESLAARANALTRANQSLAARASAPEAPGTRPALASVDVALPSPPADVAPPPAAAPRPAGPAAPPPAGPAVTSTSPPPSGASRSPWFVATLAACTAVVGLAWVFLWRTPPTLASAVAASTPAAATPAAPPIASPPAPARAAGGPHDPAPSAPAGAPATTPAASAAPATAPTASAAPATPPAPGAEPAPGGPPAPNAGRARRAPPAGAKPKTATTAGASCDPPYTYDHEGIRHFKPQCL